MVAAPAKDVVCTVAVVTDPVLVEPVETALRAVNAEMPHVRLVIAETGPLSIRFGGEWPADQPALGWTDPAGRSILINPDHPAVTMNRALAEVITHELGHVLIGPDHVNDGTMLDSRLDGQIRIGDDDRRVLSSLSCEVLGF